MSSSEIATSVADTSLDGFSGSGEMGGRGTGVSVCVCVCVHSFWLPLSVTHTHAHTHTHTQTHTELQNWLVRDEPRDRWLINRAPGSVPAAKTPIWCLRVCVCLCVWVFKNKRLLPYLCQHIYMLCLLAHVYCVCVCVSVCQHCWFPFQWGLNYDL